jgi:hypothetical protein
MSISSDHTPKPTADEKNAVAELFKEAIGYEQGLWRTFVDLRRKPKQVLDGYHGGDRKYVSPFKLLTTTLSLWILVNGFLIDWYSIWTEIMTGILNQEFRFFAWLKDLDETERTAFQHRLNETAKPILAIICRVAGDLFSKWYVPFVILSIVVGSKWFVRRNPTSGISLKETMAILSYSIGSNIPVFLVMSVAFGVNIWVGIGICFLAFPFMATGKTDIIFYAAPKSFFVQDGKTMEKKLVRSMFPIIILLQALLMIGYFIFFKYYP